MKCASSPGHSLQILFMDSEFKSYCHAWKSWFLHSKGIGTFLSFCTLQPWDHTVENESLGKRYNHSVRFHPAYFLWSTMMKARSMEIATSLPSISLKSGAPICHCVLRLFLLVGIQSWKLIQPCFSCWKIGGKLSSLGLQLYVIHKKGSSAGTQQFPRKDTRNVTGITC